MKRGTAAKVILGKDTLMDVPSGIVHGTDVILGGKAGLLNDFGGLVLSNNLMIGKKVSRGTITTVTVRGVAPIILPDAIARSLHAVKAFGGTEQNDTPAPDAPVDIVSNNGVLKVNSQGQIYTDGTVETINAHSKNLLDMATENIVLGKYINNSGVIIVSSVNFYNNKYIPVVAGETYTWSTSSSVNYFSVMEYDSSKTFLQRTLVGSSSTPAGTSGAITLRADTAFVLIGSNMDGFDVTLDKIAAVDWQFEKGSTATAYQPYYDGGTATAETLLKVGGYQDFQSIIDGVVTRNVAVRVLDGTENWSYTGGAIYASLVSSGIPTASRAGYCTHFNMGTGEIISQMNNNEFIYNCTTSPSGAITNGNLSIKTTLFSNLAAAKTWLAEQYAAGTPVILLYPLATPTTETVTGQPLQVTGGDNILEITQASLANLELEATYKSLVQLTIQEVEDANLNNNVEVTIS